MQQVLSPASSQPATEQEVRTVVEFKIDQYALVDGHIAKAVQPLAKRILELDNKRVELSSARRVFEEAVEAALAIQAEAFKKEVQEKVVPGMSLLLKTGVSLVTDASGELIPNKKNTVTGRRGYVPWLDSDFGVAIHVSMIEERDGAFVNDEYDHGYHGSAIFSRTVIQAASAEVLAAKQAEVDSLAPLNELAEEKAQLSAEIARIRGSRETMLADINSHLISTSQQGPVIAGILNGFGSLPALGNGPQ